MAAPTFVAASAQVNSTGAAQNIAWPAGYQVGDIAIVVYESHAVQNIMEPPGLLDGTWNDIFWLRDVNSAAGSWLGAFWRRATTTSEAAFQTAAQTDHVVARMFVFRGGDTSTTPFDEFSGAGTATSATATTTVTFPTVTTADNDTMLLFFASRPNDVSTTTIFGVPSNANLTGLAEAGEAGTTSGTGGGLVLSYGVKATAGATGSTTMSKTTSLTHAATVIGLKPYIPPAPLTPKLITQYDSDHTTVTSPGQVYDATETPYLDFDVMIDSSSKMEDVIPKVEIEKVGTAFDNVATHTAEDPMVWNSDIPSPRRGGQVIYDSVRERFIVLYGAVGSNYVTDVYELSTRDTAAPNPKWRKLSPSGTAPAQRYYFGGGFDHGNNRAYIFGGYNGSDLNDFWELSFANSREGVWTQRTPSGTAPLVRGNIGQSTAYDARDQKFWLFGGWGAAYYNDLQQLDLTTTVPAWTALKANGAAGSPGIRRNALMVHDKTGNRLIIYGGNTSGTANKNDTWEFNLSNNTFTQLSPGGTLPPIAELQTGVYDIVNRRMLMTGGWTGAANSQIQSIWSLDLTTTNGTWTNLSDDGDSMPLATYGAVSDVDTKHNYWYHFGGVGADGSGNIETQRDWTVDMNANLTAPVTVSSLNKNTYFRALDAPGFAYNPDRNEMMFAGGYSNMTDDATITTGDHFNGIYVYDQTNDRWRNPMLNLHSFFPREGALLVYDTNRDRFILFGGYSGDGIGLNDTWEIKANSAGDYISRRMRPTGTLPAGRWLMTGAYDAVNDRVVITQGGEGYQGANLNEVWTLTFGASEDGAWAQRTPTGSPTTATWGAMYANDTDRNRLYIVGGTTSNGASTFTNVVRYLDYTTTNCAWTTGLTTGPSARRSGVMVFDPTNDRLIVFAGYPGSDNNETWFYNIIGNSWAQATIASSPPARRSHGGAFINGKMYIASGRPNTGTWRKDTWELTPNYGTPNSSTWTEKTPPIYQRATVRVPGLGAGDYHWQAWASWSGSEGAKDSFGGNLESATDLTFNDPTYTTFEIAAVMSNTGSTVGTTTLCLWNRTDNVMVAGSEISTTNNYPTLVRGTLEYNATNFVDLKDYEFRVKASSGTANVWAARLFVRLKSMKKATTWNRVSKLGFTAMSAAAAATGNRFLYTAADYTSPTAYWEVTGTEDTNGTNAFWLLDLNATDSGTTGTDMAGTGIDVNSTTKTRARVTPVTLTDTDRYIGVFRYTSGGARYHHGILGITASSATPGINVASIIELMDTGRSSQVGLNWNPRVAWTPFNPNNYDNATFYFEIIGTNSHATIAYPIQLLAVNSLGQETVVASQNLNAATGSSNVRYRTGAITFPNGTDTVRVVIPGTAASKNVILGNARIIVKQAAGTKAVLQIPMGGSNNEENTQTGWPIVTTTNTTYAVLANNVDQFTIWRRDDSEFATYYGMATGATLTVSHSTSANKKKAGNVVSHTTSANKKKANNTVSHTTSANKKKTFTKTHTTDAYTAETVKEYTRANSASIPTGDTNLATAYNSTDYTNVSTSNNVRVSITGSDHLLHLYKDKSPSTSHNMTFVWEGQSTLAPLTSPIYLEIYNRVGGVWETLDMNDSSAENVDITLTGSVSTNLANYYNGSRWIAARIRQEAV